MDRSRDEDRTLDRDDERFVERIRTAWTPAPMTAFERTRFDARLQERLERAHRRVGRWPALGAGLAAAAVAALLIVRVGVGPAPSPLAAADPMPAGWAEEVLYATVADELALDSTSELPAEYAAIGGLFLDL